MNDEVGLYWDYTLFFISNAFISNTRLKIIENYANAKATFPG